MYIRLVAFQVSLNLLGLGLDLFVMIIEVFLYLLDHRLSLLLLPFEKKQLLALLDNVSGQVAAATGQRCVHLDVGFLLEQFVVLEMLAHQGDLI